MTDTVIEALDGAQLVRLTGRLDSVTSSAFEKSLLEQFQTPGARVVLDFTTLDYVSSAGLRVVLMAAKRAKQGQGRLVLFGLQPNVKEVFEISGFLKILEVAANQDEAVQRLAA